MANHPDKISLIKLIAQGLHSGETIREVCPMCNGGNEGEKSLSVTHLEDGTVLWNCFRASCPSKAGSTRVNFTQAAKTKTKPRKIFEGKTEPLSDQQLAWIENHWGISDPPYWYWTNYCGGRIAMSVRSPKYAHRGWSLRSITGGSPKALTYIDGGQEGLSWYKQHRYAPTVVVEDIPSAVRAHMSGVNAVALLGTGLGLDRAAEIADYATKPIVMALDQDATEKSFEYANKYALFWEDVVVLPLEKDLKDQSQEEIEQCLKQIT